MVGCGCTQIQGGNIHEKNNEEAVGCSVAPAFGNSLCWCQSNETASSGGSGDSSGTSSESSGSGEIITIQYYGGGGNPQKYYEWQQEYFEEKIGVRVEALVKDKEQLQPMVAAGNLPDMGHFTNDGDPTQLIKGGHVADLTEYESMMPNYVENWPASVQYVKDYKSDGTGKLYEVLLQLGTPDNYPSILAAMRRISAGISMKKLVVQKLPTCIPIWTL